MVRFESTTLPHTFSIFPARSQRSTTTTTRTAPPAPSSTLTNNGNSRVAPYSRDTPHNYTIQLCNSISIQTCTTHAHTQAEGGSLSDPLSYQGCVERDAKSKTEKCGGSGNFRGFRMKRRMRYIRKKGVRLRKQHRTLQGGGEKKKNVAGDCTSKREQTVRVGE